MAMPGPTPTLGTLLGDEAARRGITHAEAAARIGVSQATFSRWVAGTSRPTPPYWSAIARFLKVRRRDVIEHASLERRSRTRRREQDRLAVVEADVAELKRLVAELVKRVDGPGSDAPR
jgi:transcriptional regulator with XRE-family HTH domain